MKDLFSEDIIEREVAAGSYQVFAEKINVPKMWQDAWGGLLATRSVDGGLPWPKELAELVGYKTWPDHAFGTANAACLVLWHRPGLPRPDGVLYIEPPVPVLGGIPHPHNVLWPQYHPSPSWRNLHKYLPQAFHGLKNPWSQVMVACLNPELGPTGKVDREVNREAIKKGGRLDRIVSLCRPKVILACGQPVHEAVSAWNAPSNVQVLFVSHPLKWDGHGGQHDGPQVAMGLERALYGHSVEIRGISRTSRGNLDRAVKAEHPQMNQSHEIQDVTDFIERIGRRLIQKRRANGFNLWMPGGHIFGFARQNQNGTFTVYSHAPFTDLLGRFRAQSASNDRTWIYRFAQGDIDAREYALRVLRSAYDSQ